ncbi:hypothetical protein [Palleronia abyssalis]|uniref:WD40 repeat domain-containing protein n=1 Tax=Palleronia abyssalis TaxID=1501240 RepID=A0A2R8BVU1_9RHOB|nr:hypothetical protein [Palleronia abyssalis]SPJ24243.1 hypothetical protein PAA8504_02071 [Palleronia abyssalis]
MMRSIISATAVILLTVQTNAQDQNQILPKDGAAAEASLRSLGRGDREGAIRAVLEALPSEPTVEELDLYPEAMEALWRAVASRIVVIEDSDRVVAATDPGGTRMLIADGAPDGDRRPLTLHDAQSGAMIAEIASAEIAESPTGLRADSDLRFSPDGAYASASLYGGGVIVIIDTVTGERIFDVAIEDMKRPLGFSDDSRLFAIGGPNGLVIRDSRSGELIFERSFEMAKITGPTTSRGVLGWLSDKSFLVGETELGGILDIGEANLRGLDEENLTIGGPAIGNLLLSLSDKVGRLVEIGPGIEKTVLDDFDVETYSFARDPGRDDFVLSGDSGAIVASKETGLRSVMPGSPMPAFLTRGGEAIVWPANLYAANAEDLQLVVRDLDGHLIDPIAQDYGPFGAMVFSTEGDLLGVSSLGENSGPRYRGKGVPTGMDLFDLAVSIVPDAAQGAGISAVNTALNLSADDASRDFARIAARHLAAGQKQEAIIASLKGIPANPSASDLERFDEAHRMLRRSYAARPAILEDRQQAIYVVNRTGSRGVVMQPRPDQQSFSAHLVDVELGEIVVAITHADLPATNFNTLSTVFFSPDGSQFILLPETRDRVSIFRSSDGTLVRDLMIPDLVYDEFQRDSVFSGGFSPDGRLVAAGNDGRIMLFAADTGEMVEEVPVPADLVSPNPMGWGGDGRLFISGMKLMMSGGVPGQPGMPGEIPGRPEVPGGIPARPDISGGVPGRPDISPTEILIYKNGSFIDRFALPPGTGAVAGQSIWPSPHGEAFILTGESSVLFDEGGGEILTIPGGRPVYWTREGSAVVIVTQSGNSEGGITVVDLDGNELPPEPGDYAPMDAASYSIDGHRLSYGPPRITFDWGAEDVPDGAQLVDLVWSGLSQDVQDQIQSERVQPR